jgi:hypothetical protein
MRNEERSRFAGSSMTFTSLQISQLTRITASSGISKPSYRSGRRYDPVRDILV